MGRKTPSGELVGAPPGELASCLLTQAGRWGECLGRIDLTFDKNPSAAGYTLSAKKSRLEPVDAAVADDPEIAAIAKPYHDETEALLRTVIAQASDSLSGADARA